VNTLSVLLKEIKNLLPYFLLIAVYFYFVNLEAGKEKNNNLNSEKENILPDDKSSVDDKQLRISIPVIPYDQ